MSDRADIRTAVTDSLTVAAEPLRRIPTIEKFTAAELTALRAELGREGLDSWQAADVATSFLIGHGYGVSTDGLRDAVTRMESFRCSIDCLQAELERVAFIQ